MEQTEENILSGITNIKVPGMVTIGYWSILETETALHFVKTGITLGIPGSGALTIMGAIGDAVASREAKQTVEKKLSDILSQAEQYVRFSKEQLPQIELKKRLFGGVKIKFPNGKEKSLIEKGYVKMKLSRKKYALLQAMLQRKNFPVT